MNGIERMSTMTNKEAAARLKCSVSTAKRYCCGWCEQSMIEVAKGNCGAAYEFCDTDQRTEAFASRERRRK